MVVKHKQKLKKIHLKNVTIYSDGKKTKFQYNPTKVKTQIQQLRSKIKLTKKEQKMLAVLVIYSTRL